MIAAKPILITIALLALIYAYVGRQKADQLPADAIEAREAKHRVLLCISRTLRALFVLMLALLAGCADVKVVAPHVASGPQDARYVYGEVTTRKHPEPRVSDEPIGIACEPDPTHRYPCRAPADSEFDALAQLHTHWVESHTITVPVGKCVMADMGTTAAGYLLGFHEGGIPIAFKAAITWWQVQASVAAARQGDLSIAEISALTHCAGAAINLAKFAGKL